MALPLLPMQLRVWCTALPVTQLNMFKRQFDLMQRHQRIFSAVQE